MKVIKNGVVYQIQPKSVGLLNSGLPIGTYFVRASEDIGLYLEEGSNLEPINEKVYGSREDIVERLFKSYAISNRSLGVVLSGDKGIGKSLFARMAALQGYDSQMPLIIVDRFYHGMAQYLQKIEQEVIILFDEFEKVFKEEQDTMLSLFDGISPQKRMYIITANRVGDLNEFLVNRPGRFHYHLRFEYPTYKEIQEYMGDNLDFGRDYIDQVASLGYVQPLNYDTLRAIAFELNQNYSLADSLSVLNILATSRELNFEITLTSTTGQTLVKESFGEYNIEGSISLREATFLHVNGGYIGFRYEDFDIKGDPTPDGFFLIDEESMRSCISYNVDSRSEEYKSLTKSEQEDFAKAIQGFKNGSMKVRIIPAPTMHIKL